MDQSSKSDFGGLVFRLHYSFSGFINVWDAERPGGHYTPEGCNEIWWGSNETWYLASGLYLSRYRALSCNARLDARRPLYGITISLR